MAGQMWFGTPGAMRWVPCPSIPMELNTRRWSSKGVYLNGGSYMKRSTYGSRVYQMAWEMASTDTMETIKAYVDGLYGEGLIYFLDPFALAGNVLPSNWAAPGLIEKGAPRITTAAPTAYSNTAANTLGYPVRSATLTSTSNTKTIYVPVPEGMNFYFGWHGTGTGTFNLTPDVGSQVNANAALGVTSTQRTNFVVPNPRGVTIRFSAGTAASVAGVMGFVGTAAPAAGGFVPGRGNSGCAFDPEEWMVSGYSAPQAFDKVSVSATLVEVGAWL